MFMLGQENFNILIQYKLTWPVTYKNTAQILQSNQG